MGQGRSKQVLETVSKDVAAISKANRPVKLGKLRIRPNSVEDIRNRVANLGPQPRICPPYITGRESTANGPIHEKDEIFVKKLSQVGEIVEGIADVGQKYFDEYMRIQNNPKLLDGPEGLLLSDQQKAAAEARLMLPPTSEPSDGSGSSALVAQSGVYGELVDPLKARAAIPEGEFFPPRPSEGKPGDQLVLAGVPDELQLDRNEILEIFVKRKQDPEYWTTPKLAKYYGTDERWLVNLLRYTMAPTTVRVQGSLYGVYEIRDPHGDLSADEKRKERNYRRAQQALLEENNDPR